jgi:hypothetical protein
MPLDDLARAAISLRASDKDIPAILPSVGPSSTPAAHLKSLSERDRFVLELFRHLAVFRTTYDEEALQSAARHAERRLGRDQADEVMADAVLLDNELRCQTPAALTFEAPMTIEPSAGELDFLALLKAGALASDRAAIGACRRLQVADSRALLFYATRLAHSLGWTGSNSERAGKDLSRYQPSTYSGL